MDRGRGVGRKARMIESSGDARRDPTGRQDKHMEPKRFTGTPFRLALQSQGLITFERSSRTMSLVAKALKSSSWS